uniref:Tc1-like transposase DDE domain-containing protein n=1 Tax=Acrobeloides nanus TaxID=290746 RepID=A0A914EJ18_9BILA
MDNRTRSTSSSIQTQSPNSTTIKQRWYGNHHAKNTIMSTSSAFYALIISIAAIIYELNHYLFASEDCKFVYLGDMRLKVPGHVKEDGALAHKANETQEFLQERYPDFITFNEWPPSSPDLNAMDYAVWSILKEKRGAEERSRKSNSVTNLTKVKVVKEIKSNQMSYR